MSRRLAATLILALCLAALASAALAQTTAPQRVENEAHHFAYTCEAGAYITYRDSGNGFTCLHKRRAGVAGDCDYGLLVFGSPDYSMSEEGAEAAAKDGKLPTATSPTNTQEKLNALVAIDMQALGRQYGGEAQVTQPDGKQAKVPYYTWSQRAGSKTHYALMYVVLHGTSFIAVQLEASAALSPAQTAQFTQSLELLAIPQ